MDLGTRLTAQVLLLQQALLAQLVQPEQRVLQVLPELQALQVRLAQQALLGQQVQRVLPGLLE
jgi:hypothetical protein